MNSTWTRWLTMLAASSALALGACGDSDGGGGGGDTDAGIPDDGGDDGGIIIPDTDTPDGTGGTCGDDGTECARTSDCTEALGNNFVCVAGCCEEEIVPEQCTRHLAECSAAEASNDQFVCDTGLGLCLQRCADTETEDANGSNCPLNSFCFQIEDPNAPEIDGVLRDGLCIPGDCQSMFGGASNDEPTVDVNACDGVDAILDDVVCSAGTCTCQPIGNGASYCVGAGEAGEGDECGADTSAAQTCQAGLLCFRGTCEAPCNTLANEDCTEGDADNCNSACGDGTVCNPVFDTTSRNQPGVCGADCGDFEGDVCPDGSVCTPGWGRFGVNDWVCSETTEEPAAEGEECDIEIGNFGDCAEGLICVVENEGDEVGTCTALCDPDSSSEGSFAGCADAGPGAEVIGLTSFAAASQHVSLAEGDYDVEIRAEDGSLVGPLTVEIVAGEVVSAVATLDEDSELDVLEFIDLADGETLPATGLRAIHAAGDAGLVDAYLGVGVPDIAYGEPTGFVELGESLNIHVLAEGAPLVDTIAGFAPTAGTSYNFIAWDNEGTATVTAVEVTADLGDLTTGDSYLRLFHGATGGPAVDVYAGCDSANLCTGANLIADGLEYGSLDGLNSPVEVAETPGDELVTVYVFAAESDPEFDDALLDTDFSIAGGEIITVVAYFDDSDALDLASFLDPQPGDEDAAQANIVHAIDGAPAVDVILEGTTPLLEDLAYGESVGGTESAYAALDAGAYSIQLRAADAESSAAPVLVSGIFDIAADTLTTAVVTGIVADETLQAFLLDDTVEAPAEGEGSVRLVHAAVGAPTVSINLPGESTEICSAISINGLGFCNNRCTPFPRDGEGSYDGCEDDESCFPVYEATDRATEISGICQAGDADGAAAGETCEEDGFIGGGCADLAVCLSQSEGAAPTCSALCEPFAYELEEPQCGADATCSPIPPLLGDAFSFCLDEPQAGEAFGPCAEDGLACADDGTLCLDLGSGSTCWPVCRGGRAFDDCGSFEGRTCQTGNLNPEVVPPYMGLCQ